MLKRLLSYIHNVPYGVFFGLFIVSGLVAVGALRHNNQTMIALRADVFAADQANGDINGALNKLRAYVYGHMNTNLSSGGNTIKPPIQLEFSYERLLSDQQQSTGNNSIYNDAQNYCQALIPASVSISGRGRVSCVQDYVTSHGLKLPSIPAGLYEFDFLSPSWSPDLAGWSLVATALFGLGFLWTFVFQYLLRRTK